MNRKECILLAKSICEKEKERMRINGELPLRALDLENGWNYVLEHLDEIIKDELTYEIIVTKRRHRTLKYRCTCCHKIVHSKIDNRLKEDNQYGKEVDATALTLMNIGNVPINKTQKIIKGLTHGEIDMSEGYIAKVQKKASQKLEGFKQDLYLELLKLNLVHWDDTVIMINQKRSCLRFYGNEKIAYFTAHDTKGKIGLDDISYVEHITGKEIEMEIPKAFQKSFYLDGDALLNEQTRISIAPRENVQLIRAKKY